MTASPFPTSTSFFLPALKALPSHLPQDVHDQELFNCLLKSLDYGKSMQYLSQEEQIKQKLEAALSTFPNAEFWHGNRISDNKKVTSLQKEKAMHKIYTQTFK